ncbi:MAG: GlxA family transcriptional regulator [Pseudomonadota bacterium]
MTGALDVLLAANELLERRAYEPVLLALDPRGRDVSPWLAVTHALADAPPLDALHVVTDGLPLDREPRLDVVGPALAQVAARGGVLSGIGTGSAWLARAGFLRGHRCTLHWTHVAALAARHPDTVVSANVYEIDRGRLSCAGGSTSVELLIAWLGREHGGALAERLVAHFALERLRAPDERQRVPSAARLGGSPKLVEAVALMEANVAEPLNTDDVARLVGVSRRQLERLFKQHLGTLPSRWYLELRLEHARRLLQQTSQSILQVGLSCGFSSAPHFSNAYRNHFGRTPRDERSARAAAWRDAGRPAAATDEDAR